MMTDAEIKFAIVRARNLSHKLILHEENKITESDQELIAQSFISYGAALTNGVASEQLDDMERAIIAGYVDDMLVHVMQGRVFVLGPTDSELCSRALTLHSQELAARLDPPDAVAA